MDQTGQNMLISLGRLGLTLIALMVPTAVRAEGFPPCPPPAANEYLLLIRGETEAQRNRIQELLPSSSTVLVCNYLEDTVVRAGGFTSLETANAWAQYMTEVEGFQAFVARPATPADQTTPPSNPTPPTTPDSGSPPTATTPTPPTPTSTGAIPYAPRPLEAGYAVLVDYQNRPTMAVEIQNSIGQAVGLAVYRQRSYLLIAYSPNVEGAASTLTVLTSKSIPGFIVDSREVVMMTPAVALKTQAQ